MWQFESYIRYDATHFNLAFLFCLLSLFYFLFNHLSLFRDSEISDVLAITLAITVYRFKTAECKGSLD